MTQASATPRNPNPEWTPDPFALVSKRWEDPRDTGPTAVMLRHPSAPFVRFIDAEDEIELHRIAVEYLRLANHEDKGDLRLPEQWLEQLSPDSLGVTFGWAPIRQPTADEADPRSSFRFRRAVGGESDQTIILVASERSRSTFIGCGFGLRVVMHVRDGGVGVDQVRVTGMTASLPFGPYWPRDPDLHPLARDETGDRFFDALIAIKPRVAGLFDFQPGTVALRGVRVGETKGKTFAFELRGFGLGKHAENRRSQATPYAFVVESIATMDDAIQVLHLGTLISVSKRALVADAVPGHARVFPVCPAPQANVVRRIRRLTRGEQLDALRKDEAIVSGANHPLTDPGRVEVLCSRFVLKDRPLLGAVRKANLPGDGPRVVSDELSAVSTLRNLREMFRRFDRYGIVPLSYFRVARLPLKGMYRSGIRPGPGKDGQTVNGRVLPTGWAPDFFGPGKPQDPRPALEVHLALASLQIRHRTTWSGAEPSRAEPVGLAADARWVWHELGHVLLMAAVGELEFRFAHSPGDALAAIASDPHSELANRERSRGETFPWVFIPRRHDRCVLHGWSWGGAMHRGLRLLPNADRDRFKSYRSEQILSSSLFRLYRSIGGDTRAANVPDRHARDSASHYAVYLIIRAIGLLPEAMLTTIDRADQFVSALIDADIATEQWTVTVTDGQTSRPDTRVGGCVHKVIRWAFEAQGMYSVDDQVDSNAPGLPDHVDVYIQDLRDGVEKSGANQVTHGSGTYVPVSLHWPTTPGTPADWHASEQAIEYVSNEIFVTVKNRGDSAAANVNVDVWSRSWSDPAPLHDLTPGNGWAACVPLGTAVVAATVAGSGGTPNSCRFGPFRAPSATGNYLILARVTCPQDRANSDPLTLYPCSLLPTDLVDLVANDNNIGLRVIHVP